MAKHKKGKKRKRKAVRRPQAENLGRSQASSSVAGKRATFALVVAGVIVCAAIAGFFWVRPLLRGEKKPPKTEQDSNSTEEPVSSAPLTEQEITALKEEVMGLAQELIRDFPNSDESLVLMGDLNRRLGNSVEVVRFWEKALKINPRRFDVYSKIGFVAFEKEQYEEAVTAWKKALEIKPSITGLRHNLARAFLELGKYSEATEELEKEIEISPRSTVSYYLLGRAYLQLKEYDKAKKYYEKVIELRPDHTQAHYGLSSVYAKQKQPDKAKEYMAIFKKLKARQTDVLQHRDKVAMDVVAAPKALVALVMDAEKLYRERGDLQKTEELLKRAATLEPKNTVCLERLASLYQMSGRIPDALAQFEQFREIEPQNPLCYLNIGILSSQLKRFADAEKSFQQVIAFAPNQSVGYRYLARLYLRTNSKLIEARKLAERAAALEANADSYFILSWACDVNGDSASALAAIEQAIQLDPDNPKYKQIYEIIKKKN
jgi:tetratricopeptide (TPR) repeat protein